MKNCLDVLGDSIQGKIVTISPLQVKEKDTICYKDARSGAFYAMGVSMKENTPVTLVVPGEYLTSTYTAITEAWFQKVNVVVIALYKNISDVKTSWMERCVVLNATFGTDEMSKINPFLENAYRMKGPVLINLVGKQVCEEACDYTEVINMLETSSPDGTKYWCYNPKSEIEKKNIQIIDSQYKYGAISKYIGMSTVSNVGILLCDAECALVDINVFRTRYANGNMKIIIVDNGALKENNIALWIESNGWSCKQVEVIDEDAGKWLLSQKKQAVLIVG